MEQVGILFCHKFDKNVCLGFLPLFRGFLRVSKKYGGGLVAIVGFDVAVASFGIKILEMIQDMSSQCITTPWPRFSDVVFQVVACLLEGEIRASSYHLPDKLEVIFKIADGKGKGA
jgi:hypothetical protein